MHRTYWGSLNSFEYFHAIRRIQGDSITLFGDDCNTPRTCSVCAKSMAWATRIHGWARSFVGPSSIRSRGMHRGCHESHGDTGSTKALELAFQVAPCLRTALVGDSNAVAAMLPNLTGNAVKFTAKGEVVLKVRTELQDESEVTISRCVTQTLEEQGKLFQMVEQVNTSTTSSIRRHGAPLGDLKRIVEMTGGEIWVESASGASSHISLYRQVYGRHDLHAFATWEHRTSSRTTRSHY